MSTLQVKQDTYAHQVLGWARVSATIVEDVCGGMLSFIPNGLNLVYDFILKRLPIAGRFFSNRLVEQLIKLLSGITIGKGLATDFAHFIFWPIGFGVGALIGAGSGQHKIPVYHGQVSKFLTRVSGQTVGGALLGVFLLLLIAQFFPVMANELLTFQFFSIAAIIGAVLGLGTKALFLLAVNTVNEANAATVRKNVQRAKELNAKLKVMVRQKAKSLILRQAQDIILQMHGAQSQQYLEEFFAYKYETIALNMYKKLDRHFDYLTDRACHGDLNALKKLSELIASASSKKEDPSALDIMLDRLFNARAIAKIKDDVDTNYDRWHYRFLMAVEGT
ncbi:MAG: hypothetical protein ACHQJ6_00280 [Candidatus Berkiellales bacterium]